MGFKCCQRLGYFMSADSQSGELLCGDGENDVSEVQPLNRVSKVKNDLYSVMNNKLITHFFLKMTNNEICLDFYRKNPQNNTVSTVFQNVPLLIA